MVGDNVEIEILDEEKNLGNIEDILPRFNWLNRPAVANVDQTVIIFAVSAPAPNFNLLDRFLINMEQHEVPTVICFNKVDLEAFVRVKIYADLIQRVAMRYCLSVPKAAMGLMC